MNGKDCSTIRSIQQFKKPLQTSAGLLKFSNTCSFDSIIHYVRAGYVDWSKRTSRIIKSILLTKTSNL